MANARLLPVLHVELGQANHKSRAPQEAMPQASPSGLISYPWCSSDPWEGCQELAEEDFEAFQTDFQQRRKALEARAARVSEESQSLTSLSTTCSSKSSCSSARLEGTRCEGLASIDEPQEDDAWELEFLHRVEELSKKEADMQSPVRRLARRHIRETKAASGTASISEAFHKGRSEH
ncbi:unnamed protein product [Effrenium voratum]|uniref:Uncharacterized protein n=1 Tax=Effrenium voratum TaxID=2562239 RepID=A0AA36J8U3_9DINO|nr:unnamed protein product [Effrenium voratum]